MTDDTRIPQWLKEALSRGYKPARLYHDFDNSMFGYINSYDTNNFRAPLSRSFVLEGLPGGGKTTLLERLSTRKNIHTIQQILPNEPLKDQDVDMHFYFNSEQLKAREIETSPRETCLLDRYYVSTLAFYWAYDKINDTNAYDEVYKWYENALATRLLWQPFAVFYIEVDLQQSITRKGRLGMDAATNIWSNKLFLKHFDQYYRYFYTEIEPRTNVYHISGSLSLDEIEARILGVMNEK